jgi:hypothetical protein
VPLSIREPLARDEPALLRLLPELGYPTTAQVLAGRLRRLKDDLRTEVFVAELEGEIVGLAVLHVIPLPERPPSAGSPRSSSPSSCVAGGSGARS